MNSNIIFILTCYLFIICKPPYARNEVINYLFDIACRGAFVWLAVNIITLIYRLFLR